MSERTLISVVIPTYNRAQLAIAAIESVLAQTYSAFEIIVVDDGSTDGTREAVEGVIHQKSGRIDKSPDMHYFYQANQGQSAARNRGIAESRGDWIAFLDSDDIWLPDKLEWQVRAITTFKDCGACFTDARLTNNLDLDTTAFQFAGRQYENAIGLASSETKSLAQSFGGSWIQTLIARSDLVRQISGFDTKLRFAEDHDFLFRLSLATSYCYVNKPLALIDRTNTATDPSAASRPWDNVEIRLLGRQQIYEKWLTSQTELPEDVRKTIIQNLRAVHSGWTNWYLENGQFAEARSAVTRAIEYQLTPSLAIKWALTIAAPRLARAIAPKSSGWMP